MKSKIFLILFFSGLISINLSAQNNAFNARYKGKEIGLRKFIALNVEYPGEALATKTIGYSITSITITPEGDISDISTINPIHKLIDRNILSVLQRTKKKWLKCDTITTNQTFYIPIVYVINQTGNSPKIINPFNKKYNFIEPTVVTALGLPQDFLPENKASLSKRLSKDITNKKYTKALECIDELIRRNPFNKDLYQLRMMINRKLKRNDMVLQDINKLRNFIPGVSLDELINNKTQQ